MCGTIHPYDAREDNLYGPGTACSGVGGRFTIVGLEPGSYPVQVIDRSGAHAPLFLPDQPDSLHATRYRVGLGQNVTVTAALVGGGEVTGRLVDSAGEPVFGCVVARSARTGEQIGTVDCGYGSYRVYRLGTNAYKIEMYYGSTGSTFYPSAGTFRRAPSVAVTDGATTSGIDITVPAA